MGVVVQGLRGARGLTFRGIDLQYRDACAGFRAFGVVGLWFHPPTLCPSFDRAMGAPVAFGLAASICQAHFNGVCVCTSVCR